MPRGQPDEETYEPRVPAEDLPRKIVPRAEGISFAPELASAAQSTLNKYNADSATWAGDQIAQARVKAVNDLEQAKQNAPDGDQTGFTQKYLAKFDADNAKLAESAGSNQVAGQMVQKGLSDLRDTLATHTMQWEAQQNVSYRVNSLQDYVKSQSAVVEAHPELRTSVGSTAMDMLSTSGLEPGKRLGIARQIDSSFSEAAANGLTRQNPQAMYQALSDPEHAPSNVKNILSGLSDTQRETVLAKAKAGMSSGYSDGVVQTYRSAGPLAGAQALSGIDKLDQPADVKAQIYADVEKGLGQWHAEARQTHQQDLMTLEEHLASGKSTPADSQATVNLWKAGALTADQAGEMRGRIAKAQEKGVDDDAWLKTANAAYQNGQGLDPKDKNARDAVSAVFDSYTKGVQPGSTEWINRGADIAQKTGVTPDPIVQWSRTALVSGAPAVAAQAAEALQRQQEANPRGVGYSVDPETKALAKMVNDAVHAGTDPTVAVTNGRQIMAMPDADKQRLEEIYKQQKVAQGAAGSLSAELKADPQFKVGFFESRPAAPPSMVGEFEELRQNYFKLTNGNTAQASDLAYHDLKNTWGVTQVNGKKEYMQFAPESMNPGLTTENLRQDMQESVKGHTEDPSKVRLIATADTFHSGGQRWGLGVPDKFGAYDVIRDARGNPLPYQLPTAQASFHADQQKAATEGMTRLHAARTAAEESEKAEWEAIEAERGAPHNQLND
jgi:hypothetical protein